MGEANTQVIFLLVVTACLVMLVLSGAIIWLFIRYQKRLMQAHLEQQHIKEQARRSMLTAVLQAQEQERRRIGSDLHDEIGTMLSAARLQLTQIQHLAPDSPQIQQLTHSATGILDDLIGNIRRTAAALMPRLLDRYGLVKAIKGLADVVNSSESVQVKFSIEGPALPANREKELVIYRVLQELLNNSLRHANASMITITLKVVPGQMLLHYSDNGIGFDTNNVALDQQHGIGLLNVESRLTTISASCKLISSPGNGTQIEAAVPWPGHMRIAA